MSKILERIVEQFEDEELLVAEGFDDAIIGIDARSLRIIYSIKKCIGMLCFDMSEEDAIDHFYYNVEGSYVGEKTPIWCDDLDD